MSAETLFLADFDLNDLFSVIESVNVSGGTIRSCLPD